MISVTYIGKNGVTTVTGILGSGRYPHLYVYLDTAQGMLQIPREHVTEIRETP